MPHSAIVKEGENITPSARGQLLVADFQSAMVNLATADTARLAAEESEQLAVGSIASTIHDSNPIFITPRDIPADTQVAVAQASVDAHLKKVQAEQIARYSAAQIGGIERQNIELYKGKKVTIEVLDASAEPIESLWFNDKTGQQNQTIYKKKLVKGIIDEINLRKNLLILKPTWLSSIILPSRKRIIVYVINPASLNPAVSIRFL